MRKIKTDHILSISAIITAVVAVWIAVVEQQSNREYQRLSVEPYLELSNSNLNVYERQLVNSGLGPARIQTVEVSFDGKNISNWREAVNITINDNNTPITVSDLWNGRQIKAGERIVLIHLSEEQAARKFHSNISKLKMKICYCSMYKECWIKENSKIPKQVAQCPVNSYKSFPH